MMSLFIGHDQWRILRAMVVFGAMSASGVGVATAEPVHDGAEMLPPLARASEAERAAVLAEPLRGEAILADGLPKERVQADVSTREIAVTSSFTGTRIIVFGAVENSRQPTPESGYYDVVVIVEGTPVELMARRKSNVAGLWLNTKSVNFRQVPSYYGIATTRPLEEIADAEVLAEHEIGYDHVRLVTELDAEEKIGRQTIEDFRKAVVRLKVKDGLYVQAEYATVFTGRSLFRSTIDLPANITVGPLDMRVYLFRNGELLAQQTVQSVLERQGLERFLHSFAFGRPFLYGLVTVIIAVAAGLGASAVFTRSSH